MAEHGIDLRPAEAEAEAEAAPGATIIHVAVDGRPAGRISITDPVRPEAAQAVAELTAAGRQVWLLSGDSPATAAAVGAAVGIAPERVRGGTLPADKASVVAGLQAAGRRVAMVGDGINDAPALAQADVGVAIGSGADVAVEASDVTLVGGDPRSVVRAIDLSRRTTTVIRQNLAWAFGYNVLLIPVAMGVLYPFTGTLLNPGLAAGAMAISSVSVVTNSLRLRRRGRAAGRGTSRRSRSGPAIDPVCGMTVDPPAARSAGLHSRLGEVDYYFCARGCKLEFDEHPATYLAGAPSSS